MIEALGVWLRQVVAAVLLAALIDLLLPNRTMQRYVRLVAGLFILLTLAAPLLHWIKGDMDAKLTAGIRWAEREPYDTSGEGQGELESIMADARRISEGRTEQAAQLAAAGLEAQIKAAIEQEEDVEVDGVKVQASVGQDGTLDVGGVTVRMKPTATGQRETDGRSPIAEVDPVAPVSVDFDVGTLTQDEDDEAPKDAHSEEAAAAAAAEANAAESTDQGQAARIAAIVAGRFGIPTAKVAVIGSTGQGG